MNTAQIYVGKGNYKHSFTPTAQNQPNVNLLTVERPESKNSSVDKMRAIFTDVAQNATNGTIEYLYEIVTRSTDFFESPDPVPALAEMLVRWANTSNELGNVRNQSLLDSIARLIGFLAEMRINYGCLAIESDRVFEESDISEREDNNQ